MKNAVLICAAGLAGIFILAGCGGGGGGSAAPNVRTPINQRVITCENCQAAQIQALGSAAVNASPGDTVMVTLILTESQHAEVLAWLNGNGDLASAPPALCQERIYESHAETHGDFADTHRWAIIRNRITLFAAGRQEHGGHITSPTTRAQLNAALRTAENAISAAVRAIAVAEDTITQRRGARNNAIQNHVAASIALSVALSSFNPRRYRTSNRCLPFCRPTCGSDACGAVVESCLLNCSTRIERERIAPFQLTHDNAMAQRTAAEILYQQAQDAHAAAQRQRANAERDRNNAQSALNSFGDDLTNAYQRGDIIRVLEQGSAAKALVTGDYRVLQNGSNRILARAINLPNGNAANNCTAAPVARQYYVLESGDNAWRSIRGFAFNMRGILHGDTAIQTENFLFAHADNLRDLHVELRANPMTLAGIGLYADTGYKWEDEGETQAQYGKLMGVYPLLPDDSAFSPVLDLYASTSAGEVNSDYYEDSRLRGFAVGIFARRFLRHNDEWHVRMRQPLAAAEIAAWQFAADARIGAPDNLLSIGYYRELHGKSGATLIWRREF